MSIRQGSALILAIVFISIILGASVSLVNYSTLSSRTTTAINYYTEAKATAEAGLEKALWCLRQTVGTNCGGTYDSNYIGESNIPFGPGVFTIIVTPIDGTTKKVESTGYIPNAINPKKKVTLRTNVEINSQGVGMVYAMQIGQGGIEMNPNSTITGSVFSAGTIVGSDNSTITGDAKVAKTIALLKDQEWTTQNTDLSFGKNTPERYLAQSFTVTTSSLLNYISLYIKKVGSPTALSLWLARDNNGEPLASMQSIGSIAAATVGTTYANVTTTLTANPPLIVGKTYWLVFGPSSGSDTQYYVLGTDNTDAYLDGALKSSQTKATGSWVTKNSDANFAIYIGGVETIIDHVSVNGNAEAGSIKDGIIGGTGKTKKLIDHSTIGGSAYSTTINNSTIGGNAYADVITASTIGGTQNPGTGLEPPLATDFPFTTEQINTWKAAAAAGGVQNGDYILDNNQIATLGPKKIIGNMSLTNNVTLTLAGVIHVTGNLTLDNNVLLKLDPGYGSLSGMIIVDGVIDAGNNVNFQGSGQAGSYILAVSLAQDNGTYNSPAIDISNNMTGVIFFAPYGLVNVDNNAGAKQITALKIKLNNNAIITYESGLASAEFSTGPAAGWAVVPGTFQEIK